MTPRGRRRARTGTKRPAGGAGVRARGGAAHRREHEHVRSRQPCPKLFLPRPRSALPFNSMSLCRYSNSCRSTAKSISCVHLPFIVGRQWIFFFTIGVCVNFSLKIGQDSLLHSILRVTVSFASVLKGGLATEHLKLKKTSSVACGVIKTIS